MELEYLSEWPPQEQKQCSSARAEKRKLTHCNKDEFGTVKVIKRASPLSVPATAAALSLIRADHSVLPDVILSRWWKKEGGMLDLNCSSTNPRTLLHHIARLPEGQAILNQRISHLKQKLPDFQHTPEEWLLHYNLASCYHKLSPDLANTKLALKHTESAIQLQQGEEADMQWLLEQLVRQKDVEEKKIEMEKRLCIDTPLSMPHSIHVERRCADDLSLHQFISEYALTRTPLVITGLVSHMTTSPWTLEHMKKRIGDKEAPLRRMVTESVEWARLEPAGHCTVREFIDTLDTKQDLCYLFDWSLPLNCPDLLSELNIPKYFANDYLQRTPEGSLYRESWPSLFVAPAGLVSELHVDAFGSNFWMALFQGRKRWIFFPPEHTPLLYPVYPNSTDAVFQANLASPDLVQDPLLSLTQPRECILEPGEVLYVPAGCPHRVENLEQSLAISANFVDCSNLSLVKKELRANAFVDECAKELLTTMNRADFDTGMRCLNMGDSGTKSKPSVNGTGVQQTSNSGTNQTEKILCVPWTDFKAQKFNIH